MALRRRQKHQKAAAAGAQQLAALRTGVHGRLIGLVDERVGDPVGHLLLDVPRLVEHRSHRIEISGAKIQIGRFGQTNHRRHPVGFLSGYGDLGGLLLQHRRCGSGQPRIEEQQARFKIGKNGRRTQNFPDLDRVVGMEADEIEAAIGRCVLVLLANRLPAPVDLDFTTFPGETGSRRRTAAIRVQRIQEAHRKGARRTEAGSPGGNVGNRRDLDPAFDAEQGKRFSDQWMFHLRRVRHFLSPRIADPHGLVELPADGDVHRLLDRRRQHGAAVAAVVTRQVGAAAQEADA